MRIDQVTTRVNIFKSFSLCTPATSGLFAVARKL
jgi:hypothetical protein